MTSQSWHRSSAVNVYKRDLTPVLRNISNTLAHPPSIKTETQSATNSSDTLKTSDDFKPSVTQNYVDNVRNDENLSSNVG